jgi:hypothetical protein
MTVPFRPFINLRIGWVPAAKKLECLFNKKSLLIQETHHWFILYKNGGPFQTKGRTFILLAALEG